MVILVEPTVPGTKLGLGHDGSIGHVFYHEAESTSAPIDVCWIAGCATLMLLAYAIRGCSVWSAKILDRRTLAPRLRIRPAWHSTNAFAFSRTWGAGVLTGIIKGLQVRFIKSFDLPECFTRKILATTAIQYRWPRDRRPEGPYNAGRCRRHRAKRTGCMFSIGLDTIQAQSPQLRHVGRNGHVFIRPEQ